MAPSRQRAAAILDDSRSEASSGTRDYRTTASKSRRPANQSKDKTTVSSAPITQDPADDLPRVPWPALPLEILHSYRHIHKLSTPSAYSNDYSQLILSQGVGLRSPTALAARRAQSSRHNQTTTNANGSATGTGSQSGTATATGTGSGSASGSHSRSDAEAPLHRIIGQDRVSKDQFALVVRKHFNSAGLSEQESIARFLYTVREERRGRRFRLHFQP